MYIVGIDIGKNHHEASIVSPEGKQIGHSPYLRHATIIYAVLRDSKPYEPKKFC